MVSWLKYLILGLAFSGVMAITAYYYSQHYGSLNAVTEIETTLKTANVGDLRDNQNNISISKKDVVANLITEIVNTQKDHGKDLRIQYVFLDVNESITEIEKEITSVQFKVEILDEKGRVASTVERRLGLKGGM